MEEQYRLREDGMFADYDEAIRVIHDLTQLIDIIMNMSTRNGETIADMLPSSTVLSVENITSNVHYAACKHIRKMGIIKPDGSVDMDAYESAILEMLTGEASNLPPEEREEPTITINGLLERQLKDILKDKQV